MISIHKILILNWLYIISTTKHLMICLKMVKFTQWLFSRPYDKNRTDGFVNDRFSNDTRRRRTSFEMIIFAKQFKGTHKTHKHTYVDPLTPTDKKKSSQYQSSSFNFTKL